MAESVITPEDLKRLARIVEENGLSELRYEEEDLRVTLRTASFRPLSVQPADNVFPTAHAEPLLPSFEEYEAAEADTDDTGPSSNAGVVRIEAPIMGVFYRSSSPGDPPLIEIGDTVEVGQIIGIIEAMKVFSEVPSEAAGVVRDVPAKNGGLVQPGDALVLLEAVQR